MKTPVEELMEFVESENFKYLTKEVRQGWYDLYRDKEKELVIQAHYDGYNADYSENSYDSEQPMTIRECAEDYFIKQSKK